MARACAIALCLLLAVAGATAQRRALQADESVSLMGRVQTLEGQLPATASSAAASALKGLKGLTKDALAQALELAEAQYQSNLKRRAKRMGDNTVATLGCGDFESYMLVPTYSCPLEARLGQWGDNGKWVCLAHAGAEKKDAVALSFGTGCDTSFERDLFEARDIRTSMFDFDLTARTVDEFAALHFINYKNAGLTGSAKLMSKKHRFPEVNWLTLPGALKDAGAKFADILKIDCEGCEVDVVRDMGLHSNRTHPMAGQVLMQVHDVSEWKLPKVRELFVSMEALGFRLFHSEVNPYYKMHYDVSFIHETLVAPKTQARPL